MKEINLHKNVINRLKNGTQNMVIIQEENISNNEIVFLVDTSTNKKYKAQITSINSFKSIEDVFKMIPLKLFGNYNNIDELINEIKLDRNKNIFSCRIKINKTLKNELLDKELINILDAESLQEINIGRSVSRVWKGKNKDNKDIILKIQTLPSRVSIKDEYERLKWLEGKLNCPKVYYWNEIDNKKVLIMEFKEGIPAFKFDDIGYDLGRNLKKIHSINIDKCKFNNNSVDILLSNCLDRLDSIMLEINKTYPNEKKERIINFLKENKPTDKVLIHGDYSLPNILIKNKKEYSFIDLGDLSVSSKYFDFYYFIKSLKINKKIFMIQEFLKGYGIEMLNENYLKWMDIIDKSLY